MSDVAATPETLIRAEIQAMSAYRVAPAGDAIKLDAMENPFPWPGELGEQWLRTLRDAAQTLNRYPSAAAQPLKRQLRQTFEIPADAELLLGNGSDELIQLTALALARPGAAMLTPQPSFSMYRVVADCVGMRFIAVALRPDDFSLDLPAMRDALRQQRPALTFLAYPNNPTGNRFDTAAVEQLIAAAPGLVVIDEAYCAFSEHSFLPRVLDYDNLLVMRTLSKIGLAGLRLGFLAGKRRWLEQLEKIRLPYNINQLTQISAEFALRHYDVLAAQTARLKTLRGELFSALTALPAVAVYPSETNFITLRAPRGRAAALCRALLQDGVLIKCLHSDSLPDDSPLRDCVRISVGTASENAKLLKCLEALL